MNTSYDQATDSLYIHLADHASVDSVELTDGLVVDYDLDGAAVGIDMQKVSQATGFKGEGVQCSYLGVCITRYPLAQRAGFDGVGQRYKTIKKLAGAGLRLGNWLFKLVAKNHIL